MKKKLFENDSIITKISSQLNIARQPFYFRYFHLFKQFIIFIRIITSYII